MRAIKLPFITVLLALLAGCTLFGLEAPNTWNERLSYAYTLETGAAQAIQAQRASGQLTQEDANRLLDIVQNAKAITDGARDAMRGGDAMTAEGKLRLARSVLSEINEYLGARNP